MKKSFPRNRRSSGQATPVASSFPATVSSTPLHAPWAASHSLTKAPIPALSAASAAAPSEADAKRTRGPSPSPARSSAEVRPTGVSRLATLLFRFASTSSPDAHPTAGFAVPDSGVPCTTVSGSGKPLGDPRRPDWESSSPPPWPERRSGLVSASYWEGRRIARDVLERPRLRVGWPVDSGGAGDGTRWGLYSGNPLEVTGLSSTTFMFRLIFASRFAPSTSSASTGRRRN
mmetsp:Transcript_30612/g.85735  ORF Transcript_30612/g.85735 Transcript_30612/m.85735 type:complete len:231 (-) Transcript_30612:2134-2826(-)